MALFLPNETPLTAANLQISHEVNGSAKIFYVPPTSQREASGEAYEPAVIMEIFEDDPQLYIYPIVTREDSPSFLHPKPKQPRQIVYLLEEAQIPKTRSDVDSLLSNLNKCFIKDIRFGLGLKRGYIEPISALAHDEEIDTLCIDFRNDYPYISESVDSEGDVVIEISKSCLDEIIQATDRVTNQSRKASRVLKKYLVEQRRSCWMGTTPPAQPEPKGGLQSLMWGGKEDFVSTPKRQKESLTALQHSVSELSADSTARVAKLNQDIELVSLERLIEVFSQAIKDKRGEDHWQNLLNSNPFILTMLFGSPIVKIQDQASVGGRALNGRGEKFADFLAKNPVTENVAIVEIKKPGTPLLKEKEYRGGVFAPHYEVTAAITQVLDQKYQLELGFTYKQSTSGLQDIASYAINCCVVVGVTPDCKYQRKSFELFRSSLKGVSILTFDEVLVKLRQLHDLLSEPDIPF